MPEAVLARSLPLMLPLLGEAEAEAARRAILSGWVTQGPEVSAFEKEFAMLVGAPYACAVSNCTAALHLCLLAAGVQPGDEVITVSHSFVATANAIRYCNATPVFCDVEQATANLDPVELERALSPRTRAILCVHQMGMPCDLRAILTFARTRGLPVIEDAACAIGSEYLHDAEWELIGRPRGDIAAFSFHPRKILTTGDGGMITTRNSEWDQKVRLLRQHGMTVSDRARHTASEVVFEDYALCGFNYRMTDIQAAVGREQLRRLPEIVERRRALASTYCRLLAAVPEIEIVREPKWARSNWQSFRVLLPEGVSQRAMMQHMLNRGIATRRGICNAHQEPAYRASPGSFRQASSLACSELLRDRSVILPLFHQMTLEDQETVVGALASALPRERRA